MQKPTELPQTQNSTQDVFVAPPESTQDVLVAPTESTQNVPDAPSDAPSGPPPYIEKSAPAAWRLAKKQEVKTEDKAEPEENNKNKWKPSEADHAQAKLLNALLGSGTQKLKNRRKKVAEDAREKAEEEAQAESERRQEEAEQKHAEEVVQKKVQMQLDAIEREAKEAGSANLKKAFWDCIKEVCLEGEGFSVDRYNSNEATYKKEIDEKLKKKFQSNPDAQAGFELLRDSLSSQDFLRLLERNFDSQSHEKAVYTELKDQKGFLRKGVSPGISITSNVSVKNMVFIDPSEKITLQSIIDAKLKDNCLKKIKLTGHYVTKPDGSLQPVLVYHANSGDRDGPRGLERCVLDDVIEELLTYHDSVNVLAQTHQRAYQPPHPATAEEKGPQVLEWDPGFSSMLNKFKHRIDKLFPPRVVTKKARGLFEEKGGYKGPNGPACPQFDKDGLHVWESSALAWKAVRKQGSADNSVILEGMIPPLSTKMVDYNTGDTDFAAHSPVIMEMDGVVYVLASDTSRKGPKAFKKAEDIYADSTPTGLEKADKAGIELTIQLYILAANQFLDIDRPDKLPKDQKEALAALKTVMKKNQSNKKAVRTEKLTRASFVNFTNEAAVNEFANALNKLIKTQVEDTDLDKSPVAKAWENALDQWAGSKNYSTSANTFNDFRKLLKQWQQLPIDHPTKMSPQQLRALSAKESEGGSLDPLKMVWAAFNCERNGGHGLVNNSSIETNESMAKHQLFGKTRLLFETQLSSPQAPTIVMAVTEGADNERSAAELAEDKRTEEKGGAKSAKAPSRALPQMAKDVFGLIRVCNGLVPPRAAMKDEMEASPAVEMTPLAHQGELAEEELGNPSAAQPPPPLLRSIRMSNTRSLFQVITDLDKILNTLTLIHGSADDPKKGYKKWPAADKAQYILFSHMRVETGELWKNDRTIEPLLQEVGNALLDYHSAKEKYDSNKDSGNDVNLPGLKKKMDDAKKAVHRSCNKMETRTGCQKLKAICLVLGGIALLAGAAALVVFSFGGLTPAVAGLATLGIYVTASTLATTAQVTAGVAAVGGLASLYAYKRGFFNTKSENFKFAEKVEDNVKGFASVKTLPSS